MTFSNMVTLNINAGLVAEFSCPSKTQPCAWGPSFGAIGRSRVARPREGCLGALRSSRLELDFIFGSSNTTRNYTIPLAPPPQRHRTENHAVEINTDDLFDFPLCLKCPKVSFYWPNGFALGRAGNQNKLKKKKERTPFSDYFQRSEVGGAEYRQGIRPLIPPLFSSQFHLGLMPSKPQAGCSSPETPKV